MKGETAVPPGIKGIVKRVDDIGQNHMNWECRSSLVLNTEEDEFYIVIPHVECVIMMQSCE